MTHGVVYRCAGSGGTTCRTRGSGRRPYSDTPNGKITELGTWQHCRDNVTMFSGLKVVGYFIINIFVVATPFRHRDPKIFRIFLVPEALVRFRIFALSLSYNIVACPALGNRSNSRKDDCCESILAICMNYFFYAASYQHRVSSLQSYCTYSRAIFYGGWAPAPTVWQKK